MGNTNTKTETTGGEKDNELNTILLIATGFIVVMIIFYMMSSNNCGKSHHKNSIEKYINDSKKALNALVVAKVSLVDFATEYVSKRQNIESSFLKYVQDGSIALNSVKALQQTAENAYNTADKSVLSSINSAVQTASQNATDSSTAYSNIVDLTSNGGNVTSGGSVFGTTLSSIEQQKAIADNAYSSVQDKIKTISDISNTISSSEYTINVAYKTAKSKLEEFDTYINSLTKTIQTSSEFANLVAMAQNANNLKTQLTGIASSLQPGDQYLGEVNVLIASLDTAIITAYGYLDNTMSVFASATTGADTILTAYINQLITIYSTMVALIGSSDSSSSIPIQPQTLPAGQQSIVWYLDHVKTLAGTIISQYNTVIGYYNRIISNLNLIQQFTSTIYNTMNTSAETLTNSLNQAKTIMQNYFPGNTTPAGPVQFPSYTTNTPYPTYTTMGPLQ